MTPQRKLRTVKKVIDKYFDILEKLPNGTKITPTMAKKLGIPEDVIPIIERAYKAGRVRGRARGSIPQQELARLILVDQVPKGIVQMQGFKTQEDLSYILTKARAKYSKEVIDHLKRNMGVINEVFKDEPIPRTWLAQELRKITDDTRQDWDMVIRTELKNNDLEGMASSIIEGKSPLSDDGGDTLVFKKPNPDACKHCKRLYLEADQVTPRIFRLKDLMANGDNVGKKVADWKATLGVIHPHCQCQLFVKPKNTAFDKQGNLVYKAGEA